MSATTTVPPSRSSPPRFAARSALLRAREFGIGLVIVIVFVQATLKNHAFANSESVQQLLTGAAIITLLGVGQTLVIVTRNVDLSVGSILGISAYVIGMTFKAHPGMPVILGFLLGVAIGAFFGAINGLIVTVLKVPSLVVTLAALYVIRGIDGVIVGGVTINPSAIPKDFQWLGYATIVGVPWMAILVAIVVGIVGYAMRSFRGARELYAVGSNPDAAALAGIPAGRRVFTAFLVSGTLAGLGGALFLSLHATVDVKAGTGYEFLVIAACVVGGVAIFGGSGTVLGAALGAVLLNTISQALVSSKVSPLWNDAIAGALLLVAIAFDRWLTLRLARSLQSPEGAHRGV